MKYIIKYENLIKHIDPIAINHILRYFSKKLEDVIIALKNLDNFESYVKRYFHDDGKISIIYKRNGGKLLSVAMKIESEQVNLTITNYIFWYNPEYLINTKYFTNLIDLNLKKYKINKTVYDLPSHIESINYYEFPISKINNVINEIKCYYTLIHAKKYNI